MANALSTNEAETNECASSVDRFLIPEADVFESANQIVVLVDMPGVDENSFEITLEKNILTVEGCSKPVHFENYKKTFAECEPGNYRRIFHLSNNIDRDSIQASVKNGVLRLQLPKSKDQMPKKITVKSA